MADSVLNKTLALRGAQPGTQADLNEAEIRSCCAAAREVLLSQPMLLELDGAINICGDVHGQFFDVLRLLEVGGLPPDTKWLFLGDYVDRGCQSLETACLLLALKVKYPSKVFLLRGNHESASINRYYGFFDECKRRQNVRVYRGFCDVFNCLPVAAIVAERIFCCHGGLSPEFSARARCRKPA